MDSNFISDPKYSINPPHTVDSHVTEALPVGTRLYNYVITDIIGSGGFGITYRAKEDVSGRIVVIKENFPTHPELKIVYRSPEDGKTVLPFPRYEEFYDWAKNIFAKEAHTLIGLPYHPNIVQVLSVFEANNTAYFVMPFIKGCSLHERYLPPATMPEHELRPFLKDMLEALAHLHAHNVIHRDIKPQNILITPEGKPVLIDFGAARPDNTRKSATQIGTAGYAPPEQMSEKEYDKHPKPHTDLYALGATCYRLITSYEPDYMFDRLAKDPTIKGKYSSELLQSIDKAREKNPEDRWQSAQEWLAALNTTGNKGRKLGMLTSLLLLAIAVPAAYLCYHHQSELGSPESGLPVPKSADQPSPQVGEQKEQPTNVTQAQPVLTAEERLAAEAGAKVEEERLAAESTAKAEEERLAAEAAAKAEEERLAAEAKAEEERLAAEAAAKAEEERRAAAIKPLVTQDGKYQYLPVSAAEHATQEVLSPDAVIFEPIDSVSHNDRRIYTCPDCIINESAEVLSFSRVMVEVDGQYVSADVQSRQSRNSLIADEEDGVVSDVGTEIIPLDRVIIE